MDTESILESGGLEDQPLAAQAVARGVCRMLFHHDLMPVCEVPLGNGRRADIVALDAAGQVTLVEIKVSLGDLRGDMKWPEYLDYCDRYFWALPLGFNLEVLADARFMPERTGLIVADHYGAEIVRDAAVHPLHASRRRSEQLRFARCASRRLLQARDPHLMAEF